jgi:hypothetical protein
MEKSNQQRLEEYLIGNEKSYLKDDISNGKVVMLSGKWGSGKTYFWKNIIEKDLIEFQTKNQKAYIYTSLYGNTSIDKIEDNIYAQAYLCAIGGENFVLKGYKTLKDFGKRFGSFCSLLDISKLIDGVDEIQKNNIKNSALLYLEKGGIVCFDDFERKSKDIDLNDLFGFITQLTINFDCKVVIILNDDVFESEEKKIFSNVKEKSVSKFLKYEPSIRDLFKSIIFQKNSEKKFKYSKLRKYLKVILKTIEETEELNARIYIQVLDNLVEWIKNQEKDDDTLRCLILVNINFVLNHIVFRYDDLYKERRDKNLPSILFKTEDIPNDLIQGLYLMKENNKNELHTKSEFLNHLYFGEEKNLYNDGKKYSNLLWDYWRYIIKLESHRNVNDENILRKINNFIETGILIDE